MRDSEEELFTISNVFKNYMIEIADKTRKFSAHPVNTQMIYTSYRSFWSHNTTKPINMSISIIINLFL